MFLIFYQNLFTIYKIIQLILFSNLLNFYINFYYKLNIKCEIIYSAIYDSNNQLKLIFIIKKYSLLYLMNYIFNYILKF